MTNENKNELKQIINALCDQPPAMRDDAIAMARHHNIIARTLGLLAAVSLDDTLVQLLDEYEQRTGAHRSNARVTNT